MCQRLHAAGKPLAGVTVIADAALANALAPYTTVLYRMVWSDAELYKSTDYPQNEATAIAYGRAMYNGPHKPFNDAAAKAHYLQFTNESGFNPFDYAVALGLMQAGDADNPPRKIALWADNQGTPEVDQWKQRVVALNYAKVHGHAVCLHLYSRWINGKPSSAPLSDDEGWQFYAGRPETLYAAVPESARPLLIVGEAGVSDNNFKFTLDDMRRTQEKTKAWPWLVSLNGWTLGGNPGETLNDVLPGLERLILTGSL